MQLTPAEYGGEILYTIIISVIGLVFFFFYWEYMRKRPILPTATTSAASEQIAARASMNYQQMMSSIMQNLPKNLQMKVCSKCGMFLRPGAEFCDKCGTKVPDTAGEVPETQPTPTSDQLMNTAMKLGVSTEGKTREQIAKEIVDKISKVP
jgi:ribosomal protein L40E